MVVDGPTGWLSAAARSNSTVLLPADHGPKNVPKMPRAAMVARSSSVSNHSAARSAMAIGPQRSRRYIFSLPSPRTPLPAFSTPITSAALGDLIEGGVMLMSDASTGPMRARTFGHSLYFSASLGEILEMDCADFPGSS